MSGTSEPVEIPNRALFKAAEVCDLVKVQPYVLRSWEAEFPELGVAKTAGAPRVYRRTDVEQVLRIKHLLLVEGLDAGRRAPEARRGDGAGGGRRAGDRRADRPERARAADRGQARVAIDSRSARRQPAPRSSGSRRRGSAPTLGPRPDDAGRPGEGARGKARRRARIGALSPSAPQAFGVRSVRIGT